ncbi:type II secretion system protein [bacterium]|nr:type II secretion system protein [bacterium]
MRKISAFTLAEVILTMTIVGVVAAMTIPTLHYQKNKREYSAKIKNFYSRMENAIVDMEMDKGSYRDMLLPANGNGFDWYIDNVDPYMGHQYVDTSKKRVYFKDGSSLFKDGSSLQQFFSGGCLDVVYDVNGDRAPNRSGFDQYKFLYCFTDDNRTNWFGNKDIFFGTYGSGLNAVGTTRAQMIEKCKDAETTSWCTKLLQNDQWEFKHDYPHKF